MDIERVLISAVVRRKAVDEAVDNGVTPALFDERYEETWRWLVAHFTKFGESAGEQAFAQQFPDFTLPPVTESVLYYAGELRKKFAAVTAREQMKEAALVLREGGDPMDAIEQMRLAVLKVDDIAGGSRDMDWRQSQRARLERYHKIQESEDGVDGIPYPFATINNATKGKHGGELILVAADQGVGKSWLLTLCAKADYDHGELPVIFSKEMPAWQFARRLDALEYGLPYKELRDGMLDTVTYQRWVEGIEAMESGPASASIPIIDDEFGGVSHIAAKAIKHKATVIYIDGGYLMDDDRGAKSGWEAFGNVTRDLKRLAKRLNVAIVVTVQLNDQGDVAYFKGVKRDADVIFEIRRDSDQKLLNLMEIIIRKLREGAELPRPLEVMWDIDAMKFGEIEQKERTVAGLENEVTEY